MGAGTFLLAADETAAFLLIWAVGAATLSALRFLMSASPFKEGNLGFLLDGAWGRGSYVSGSGEESRVTTSLFLELAPLAACAA